MVPRTAVFVCGMLALAVCAGCAKAQAVAVPMPTLAPPDVPPRIIAEYEPDPPLPAEPVSAEAVTPTPRPTRPPRREPLRPAEAPADDPPVASQPVVPTPPPPALALQMPAASAKADQSVRALLARASRDLNRVDYRLLDADGRAQYDTAKGFMQQAEDALKARNVMFAGKLADKAATLATALLP